MGISAQVPIISLILGRISYPKKKLLRKLCKQLNRDEVWQRIEDSNVGKMNSCKRGATLKIFGSPFLAVGNEAFQWSHKKSIPEPTYEMWWSVKTYLGGHRKLPLGSQWFIFVPHTMKKVQPPLHQAQKQDQCPDTVPLAQFMSLSQSSQPDLSSQMYSG